jgi:hypothetical protein
MSRDKLNIPKTINVGFRKRDDTYTGKLAFVVYTDVKGKLRKEKSWNGWRDKEITALDFENEPTSGFVLNKKVGETRWGWNPRKAWVRVYDPRDFEFEISVANLLFILEECSAIKGKGLEGEFVYSWDGAELVLLPVSSQEYKNSSEFTALQTRKIGKKDMKDGCLYTSKENKQVMYLGRHDWYEMTTDYGSYRNGYKYRKYLKHSKQHVFVSVDGKSKYWIQKGFTKLATKLGEDPSPLFAAEFEKFKNSKHGSKPVKLVGKPAKLKPSQHYGVTANWYSHNGYIKEKDSFYPVSIRSDYDYSRGGWGSHNRVLVHKLSRGNSPVHLTEDNKIQASHVNTNQEKTLTEDQLKALKLFNLFVENEKGTLISL